MKKSLSFAMDTIEDCDSILPSTVQRKHHDVMATSGDRLPQQVLVNELVRETRQTRDELHRMIDRLEALVNNRATN